MAHDHVFVPVVVRDVDELLERAARVVHWAMENVDESPDEMVYQDEEGHYAAPSVIWTACKPCGHSLVYVKPKYQRRGYGSSDEPMLKIEITRVDSEHQDDWERDIAQEMTDETFEKDVRDICVSHYVQSDGSVLRYSEEEARVKLVEWTASGEWPVRYWDGPEDDEQRYGPSTSYLSHDDGGPSSFDD